MEFPPPGTISLTYILCSIFMGMKNIAREGRVCSAESIRGTRKRVPVPRTYVGYPFALLVVVVKIVHASPIWFGPGPPADFGYFFPFSFLRLTRGFEI